MTSAAEEPLDEAMLRDALAQLAWPVVVVTTTVDGVDYGFTASSFTSVSMTPPTLGVFLAETAGSYPAFMRADRLAFNILADDEAPIALAFARRGEDKFAGLEVDRSQGVPALVRTMVTIVAEIVDRRKAEDHVLLLARPLSATPVKGSPLIYHQRAFHRLPNQD